MQWKPGTLSPAKCIDRIEQMLEGSAYAENRDDRDVANDLLADFLHWCDAHGVDFETTLDSARQSFKDEAGQFKRGA